MNTLINRVQSKYSPMRKANITPAVDQITPNEPLNISNDADLENAFHYWQGASGKRYIHSVYSLFKCPELPQANYVLVHRDKNGGCKALSIGQTTNRATSLNLAFLRHNAARLGANEIHIHVMANQKDQREKICDDLLNANASQQTRH